MKRRGLLALAGAAAVGAAWPLRAFEEPGFETLEYDWADAARQRSPKRYLSTERGGDGKVPTWRPFQLAFVVMNPSPPVASLAIRIATSLASVPVHANTTLSRLSTCVSSSCSA